MHQLLSRYLKQFHLTPVMNQEEVEHWFYPQENIIDTFVVEVSSYPLPDKQLGSQRADITLLGFPVSVWFSTTVVMVCIF